MIPFLDLKRGYLKYKDEIDRAIADVFNSGWFILGDNVKQFEREFSFYCECRFGVGVGSGTEALHLALVASGVKYGDEVITVPNTAVPTVSAITFAGAKPVFVDILPDKYTIDPEKIEEKITEKTRAIVPVHLYGQAAEMEPILEISHKYNIPVIEDACQAHGALYKGKKVGSSGKLGCFSFYPSKNLGAYGDAGIITINDESLYGKLIKLRNYGEEKRYYHSIKGFNSRLDEIQASILRVKLRHLDEWNKKRRELAKIYSDRLKNLPVITPEEGDDNYHIYHLYVIRTEKRDSLQKYLKEKGVSTLIHYPVPIHFQEAYKDLDYKPGSLPISEKISGEILSLPLYPEIQEEEIETVCRYIRDFFLK